MWQRMGLVDGKDTRRTDSFFMLYEIKKINLNVFIPVYFRSRKTCDEMKKMHNDKEISRDLKIKALKHINLLLLIQPP